MQYFIYIFYERFKQLSAKSVMWMCGFVCRCESVCATKCSPQPSHVCIKCIGLTLLLVCCYYYLGFSFWLLALLLSLSLWLYRTISLTLSLCLWQCCALLCVNMSVFLLLAVCIWCHLLWIDQHLFIYDSTSHLWLAIGATIIFAAFIWINEKLWLICNELE